MAEGLPMGLRQCGDWTTPILRATEQHTSPAEAPDSAAAGLQAAGLPTPSPAFAVRQRVPAQGDEAAPVELQHAAGHPAQIR